MLNELVGKKEEEIKKLYVEIEREPDMAEQARGFRRDKTRCNRRARCIVPLPGINNSIGGQDERLHERTQGTHKKVEATRPKRVERAKKGESASRPSRWTRGKSGSSDTTLTIR